MTEDQREIRRKKGSPLRRYQDSAIDDPPCVRVLKTFKRHTQANTIDYVVEKFSFRIRTVRADLGHEFQALFHWHVADQGMKHVHLKPRTPQLNDNIERSHRTDKDDVALEEKLAVWERFYNFDRPHGVHGGKTPYEALREKLLW
ncbi:MAG: hypothetical protein CL933_23550 [Deltaproteobacteria bacterium]|nr:hypothetical protein [Deltaproteobacteria bacterium]